MHEVDCAENSTPSKLDIEFFSDDPVLCIKKSILQEAARKFLTGFPGRTLYAVKCNPHPIIIRTLINAGIKNFDTASLEEIRLVKSIDEHATCYFNHPIKTRRAIYEAYYTYEVKDFVIDSVEEWNKISTEIDTFDITVQLRMNAITGSNIYDFNHKFGMEADALSILAHKISNQGVDWALSFHVGSQCENPDAFIKTLYKCNSIIKKIHTPPKYINVGGGFPGYYPNSQAPELTEYFIKIDQVQKDLLLPDLFCEPGRALVCHAGELIVRVVARKEKKLYLNDGIYGALGELNYAKLKLRITAIRDKHTFSNTFCDFTIFGPTCDSFDTLDSKFYLPEDIAEGDWIIISDLGAYSTSLSSNFNGFCSNKVILT